MNDLVSRMLGEDVPVPCAMVTTKSIRNRTNRFRRDRDGDDDEGEVDESNDTVRRVLGESDDESDMDGIIPDDAQDLETSNTALQTPMRPIKNVVQEPTHPTGDKEKLLTPYAALTAPDVTPMSMEPIDPSKVPGLEPSGSFKRTDLEAEGTPPSAETSPSINAMDVLLGRKRGQASSSAPQERGERVDEPTPVVTEEAAQRMVNSMSTGASGEAVLQQGVPMPAPPPPSNGSAIMEAMRRATRKA